MIGGLRFGRRSTPGGFTVVETMVVLSVTGALFVSIVMVVAGRQQQVQFNQAVSNIKAEIETVINEAQTGYPGGDSIACRYAGNTPTTTTPDNSCIFLGKAIQFTTNATEKDRIAVHTVVGQRESTSLATATPYMFGFETRPLWYGLEPVAINAPAGMTRVSTIAFVLDYEADSTGNPTGSQAVKVQRVVDSLGQAFSTQDNVPAALANISNGGATICLAHGGAGADRSVRLVIGAGQSTRVDTEIKANGTCA